MAGTLYVGMDLGKRFHQVAVVDERKEAVGTPFRVNCGMQYRANSTPEPREYSV